MTRLAVVTCHGVNSDGEWQDRLAAELSAFYQFVPARYTAYRRFGFVKQILGTWTFGLVIAIVALAILFLPAHRTSAVAVALVVVPLVGLLEARARRIWTMSHVRDQFNQAPRGRKPHLVVHSFGTFLATRLLDAYAHLSFNRVIFVGSVVDENYSWETLLRRNPDAFVELRNEVGAYDRVPRIAGLVARLCPGMGRSGALGFRGPTNLVHDLTGAWRECVVCSAGMKGPVIHNVPLRLNHSDYLNTGHFYTLWLPFLLGVDAGEFRAWVELCVDLHNDADAGAWESFETKEVKFRTTGWKWAAGSTDAYIRRQLVSYHRCHDQHEPERLLFDALVARVVRLTWKAVAAAQVEYNKPEDRNFDVIRALYPVWAVGRAVNAVMKTELEM